MVKLCACFHLHLDRESDSFGAGRERHFGSGEDRIWQDRRFLDSSLAKNTNFEKIGDRFVKTFLVFSLLKGIRPFRGTPSVVDLSNK